MLDDNAIIADVATTAVFHFWENVLSVHHRSKMVREFAKSPSKFVFETPTVWADIYAQAKLQGECDANAKMFADKFQVAVRTALEFILEREAAKLVEKGKRN